MHAAEICNREIVIVNGSETLEEAASMMREYHVGTLVVVNNADGKRIPLGIITDRDIVVGGLALGGNRYKELRVVDLISPNLITADENDDLLIVLKRMRSAAVRRIVIVNSKGGLEGILALDDILMILSEEIADIAKIVSREQDKEKRVRS